MQMYALFSTFIFSYNGAKITEIDQSLRNIKSATDYTFCGPQPKCSFFLFFYQAMRAHV